MPDARGRPGLAASCRDDATVLFLHGDGVERIRRVEAASLPNLSSRRRQSSSISQLANPHHRRVGQFDVKVRGTTDAAAGDVVIGLGVTPPQQRRRRAPRPRPRLHVRRAFLPRWPTTSARRTSKRQYARAAGGWRSNAGPLRPICVASGPWPYISQSSKPQAASAASNAPASPAAQRPSSEQSSAPWYDWPALRAAR